MEISIVPNTYGHYTVSSTGLVFKDNILMNFTTGGGLNSKEEGYKMVMIKYTTGGKPTYVHRLVAEAFIPNDDPSLVVDHIDNDKKNNNVENLQGVTRRTNSLKCPRLKGRGEGISKHRLVAALNADDEIEGVYTTATAAAKMLDESNWKSIKTSILYCLLYPSRHGSAHGWKGVHIDPSEFEMFKDTILLDRDLTDVDSHIGSKVAINPNLQIEKHGKKIVAYKGEEVREFKSISEVCRELSTYHVKVAKAIKEGFEIQGYRLEWK